jgi:monoterpene epsilon-lactone hydrolase
MPSSEALKFAALLRGAPKMVDMDLPHQREAGEHAEDLTSEAPGITYQTLAESGVAGVWAIPPDAGQGEVVLYFFGGGHVIGSVHSRRKFGGHLALAAGCRVLILDYPLAPEHPFPADIEATTRAYRWLLARPYAPTRIALAGESSAGGLVLSTLLALKRAGDPVPAAAYLMSPWADLTCSGSTHQTCKDVDLCCTTASLLRMAGQYLHGHDPRDPLASPALADLGGLPPLLVQVGGDEILLDDAVTIVRNAGIAGARAMLDVWPGMKHFFQIGIGVYPEARAALGEGGRWLALRLAEA